MTPLETTALFWKHQCKEKNICTACHRKFACEWAERMMNNKDSKNN